MPSYRRFEELPVWQLSVDLAAKMFPWTSNSLFRGKGDLANQLQRATLSISNNIAEGFERGSTNDLLKFIYIARGSAGEVRSMLCVMELMQEFHDLKPEMLEIKSDFERVSRQLRAWADQLQNSEIKGQRHLDDRGRKQFDRRSRRNEFLQSQADFRDKMKQDLEQKARERHPEQ